MQRLLLSLSSLLVFFFVPACAPDPATKTPLAVCQEGDDGCPSVARAEKQPSASRNTGPSGGPSTPTEPQEEELKGAAEPDAGTAAVDAAADAALGALCTSLSKCCGQIEEQGLIPDNCKSVVALKHESACYAQHQQYKNAGDCS